MRRLAVMGMIVGLVGDLGAGAGAAQGQQPAAIPVVVELFTSQGCSSCPPADALLRELDGQPIEGVRLIVLSQHVDYWNSLGWKDPFSAREFSLRQRRYGESLTGGRVYTPQMVIDGAVEFVGNRRQRAYEAIATAARRSAGRIPVQVEVVRTKAEGASLRVAIPDAAAAHAPFDVMLAITESGLASEVRSGENAGRTLRHSGVVRRLESLGSVRAGAGGFQKTQRVPLDAGWDRADLRAVVFLQARDQGPILGAATVPLVGP